jgi:hypothetical protein
MAKRPETTGQRLVATLLLGAALFNYPVLSLFAVPGDIAGVPILYAYVFGAWLLVIGLLALAVARPG